MGVIGGSIFVAMLFGLWLRGGFSRWRAEARAAGKALEECFVGWLGVDKLNSGTALAVDQVTETSCACALPRLQHQYTRGSRKAL